MTFARWLAATALAGGVISCGSDPADDGAADCSSHCAASFDTNARTDGDCEAVPPCAGSPAAALWRDLLSCMSECYGACSNGCFGEVECAQECGEVGACQAQTDACQADH